MESADPISEYLPHLDFMIEAIQESRYEALSQPYVELDQILGALYGSYLEELRYLAVDEPQNAPAAQIAEQFEIMRPALRCLHDALSLSEFTEALQALEELKEQTQELFNLFQNYKEAAAKGPRYSEVPYTHELIRVGRHYLNGHLDAEAVQGRLELFCQYHELLENQVVTMVPSPPERTTFEERRSELEEALNLQLEAIEDLDLALERNDDETVAEALNLLKLAAETLVEVYRALQKADLEPRQVSCIRCGSANSIESRLCDQCHAVLPQQAGLGTVSTIALEEDGSAVSADQSEEVARLQGLVEKALADGEVEALRQAVEDYRQRWLENQRRYRKLEQPPEDIPGDQLEVLTRAKDHFAQAMSHLDEALDLLLGGLEPLSSAQLHSGLERLRRGESSFRGLAQEFKMAEELSLTGLREAVRGKSSRLLVVSLVVFVGCLTFYLTVRESSRAPIPEPKVELPERLSAETLVQLAQLTHTNLREPDLEPVTEDPLLKGRFEPVSVVLRSQRVKLASAWGEGGDWAHNLRQALTQLARSLPDGAPGVETVEICLTHTYQPIAEANKLPPSFEFRRGTAGLELRYGSGYSRYSPLSIITENYSYSQAVAYFLRHQGQDPEATLRRKLEARTFDSFQVLVSVVGEPTAVELYRGSDLEPEPLSYESFKRLKEQLSQFTVRQVGEDGSLPYIYYPSNDQELEQYRVQVRFWLATWALSDLAQEGFPGAAVAFEKNLRFMVRYFYRTDGDLGLIQAGFKEPVGTGASALAGLSILEGPLAKKFGPLEESLRRGLETAFNPDGSLATYLEPRDQSGNENFYPGEVLVYWATLYQKTRDPELLARFMKSFEYYRSWHRENRNPAFVPWHTQAYYRVWHLTKDPELKSFVFEMNDFLLSMQQWDKAEFPDFRGQFWDPERPEYGSRPHVSSTGVYLEGLTAAYRMALEAGDRERQAAYKQAIMRGLLSLKQHQFADGTDLYYVAQDKKAEGGLRTTVYENAIRIDNGAHALRAILEADRLFGEEDFNP